MAETHLDTPEIRGFTAASETRDVSHGTDRQGASRDWSGSGPIDPIRRPARVGGGGARTWGLA